MRIHARHYVTQKPIELEVSDGRIITAVKESSTPTDTWVAPSFFDLQVNGCLGISFNSNRLTIDDIRRVVQVCRAHGTNGICPTLITSSFEDLRHGFAALAEACESDADLARAMPGFHLEGPYIAVDDGPRGAHPREHIRRPDWDEFLRWQDASGGRIRIVTLAPELPGALPFIERLAHSGVVVSIGHTAATPEQIRDAIHMGARLSTHLGNGAHATLPRHPNYIWEQLAADELWASLIADGHHLPDSVLKSILRAKTPGRCVLISDASSLAGLPPGSYECWGQEFEVRECGKIVVPDTDFLAGSGVFLDACVGHVVKLGLADASEAIAMASIRPRELLGLPIPRIEAGELADLIVYELRDGNFTLMSPT